MPTKQSKIAKNPLLYWDNAVIVGTFPNVRRAALRILSSPTGALSCERLFNLLGYTIDVRSSRLQPQRASAKICTSAWVNGDVIDNVDHVIRPKTDATKIEEITITV